MGVVVDVNVGEDVNEDVDADVNVNVNDDCGESDYGCDGDDADEASLITPLDAFELNFEFHIEADLSQLLRCYSFAHHAYACHFGISVVTDFVAETSSGAATVAADATVAVS